MTHTEHIAWSQRPSFRPRQVLTAEQLNRGLEDELNRQRLLNRAVHGYGVVLGFGPVVDEDGDLVLRHECLEITTGLALDRHGRMLYWPGGHLGVRDTVGERLTRPGHYTLYAHYARRPPLTDGCPPSIADRSPWWLEGVVFTLGHGCRHIDRHCPDHPIGFCVGHEEYVCRRTGSLPGQNDHTVPVSEDVAWLPRRPGDLRPTCVEDWTYDPDPEVAVPIACLEIGDLVDRDREGPDCEPRYGLLPSPPRACSVRPLVYRNPLLYELVTGGDVALPRVKSISWYGWIERGWATPVEWNEFEHTITTTGFEVWFTRPIRVATLHEASVFLTAILRDRDADYLRSRRVPTDGRHDKSRVEPLDRHGDVAGGVRLRPTREWLQNEVTGKYSNLFDGVRFELTIRGQLLRDHCGRMLDARPIDARGHGEARPGGDFVSAFQVGSAEGYRQIRPDGEDEE
ncbi:hypothetical protein [Couchioplanes caeruleus]|uniref:Uncharacterized protein n=2 Tax=Couchioplanes caeruleus TaxID=56438 RepID=A0A1K0FNA6_9ACTN|nr:hypothetical protein [Couchioplanes caeruleus]OJF14192.1 hypothetical protein BG844_11075 [Couchioplanes caeruleus subsp. caeruleus]ROP28317.1 hypothetical protein EDD30_1064 [Couchioplanes caeruleus]